MFNPFNVTALKGFLLTLLDLDTYLVALTL